MAPYTIAQPYYPHERLEAYSVARKGVQLVAAKRDRLRGLPGQTAAQLERAVVGAQTNLCAGAAHSGAEARRFFRIALSEAAEAGGAVDLAFDFGALTHAERAEFHAVLRRLCAMLAGLSRP